MENKLTNKILIPCVVFAFALFCLSAFFLSAKETDYARSTVSVKEGNEVVERVHVGAITSFPYEIQCKSNIVCIDKDGVYMKEAHCPDKLCVNQGKIQKNAQSIVCLPNKIIVEIEGKKTDVDAVAGAR